ncbi:archaeal DNA polymerase II, small subunit/DNA polymerase delta, subunit B [Candidatus Nitrososphaera evergladensis SR1]|uniref:DNA polymerase II small subunit n=1 Tax=Candidatus Nitrososphaera evergladensis SR1 TaxID=1459636 RepID=A0A075MRY4_9ARCH|nr:DNA-directed DNA polymerase II small subunit [Candidatus Nitrososphaera evergladensis]AIF82169.1 archaeal DNA polymerase II, small subunit/DNA polymerase delta, subunit B [Candidatus Nitrososphaera evergladensis SR1]
MVLQSEIVNALSYATSKGYQIHPDAFAMLKGLETDVLKAVQEIIKQKKQTKMIVVDDVKNVVNPGRQEALAPVEQIAKVLVDPTPNVNTGEGVDGYALLFKSRFEKTMRILAQRPDSKRMTKISTVKQMGKGSTGPRPAGAAGERSLANAGTYVVSGLLMSRRTKKNGIELEVDDYTGRLQVTAASEDAKKQAANLALDQVVMLELENAKGVQGLAIKNVFSPDIPDHLPNKSRSEAYAVLISDLHVGSKYFMQQEFLRFLDWLASGDDDDVVRKIKFLCIGGDLIDGIGIFPNQDKELLMMNAAAQMAHTAKLLSKIPKHIKTFIIPGNHDPGRRALPQPIFPEATSGGLYNLENCTMLGNPAYIELNGVKVLMFHGQSLDDVIATTPGMSYQRPAEAMKVLLKARHLSPTYGGRTPVAPESEDMMVMTEVPDIFHAGHVHVTDVDSYRGTLVVNSGAWQAQTKFQQTMGITPSPGIAIVVNLATLQPFKQDFNLLL